MAEMKKDGGRFPSYFNENGHENEIDAFKRLSDGIKCKLDTALNCLDSDTHFFISFRRSGGTKPKGKRKTDLRNLLWWNIEIDDSYLKDEYKGYKNILLTPYRIKSSNLQDLKIGTENENPHIDDRTGNIHINFNLFEWLKANENEPEKALKQAVLVRGRSNPGPKLARSSREKFYKEELNIYKDGKIKVPKACYFPRLDCENDQKYSIRELLKGLLEDKLKDDTPIKFKTYCEDKTNSDKSIFQ